jgi:hypothetical protein
MNKKKGAKNKEKIEVNAEVEENSQNLNRNGKSKY